MKIDTTGLKSFIDDDKIWNALQKAEHPTTEQFHAVLKKAALKKGLTLDEVAILLQNESAELNEEMFKTARKIKEEIYGNRIVLFAPLYVGNSCINDCVYCGFRTSNQECFRKTLTHDELVQEVEALENKGQKRLIMVYGEHPKYSPQYIADTVRTVYATKVGKGEIRRVNINAAPLDVEGYKVVKAAGIGTYQIFQETYHQETYSKLHPSGPKSNFLWRLYGLDRAFEGGIDDMGIGALMGLFDWKFEVMALLTHSFHLEEKYGVGPHTISFPRIEPANGSDFTTAPPHAVSNADFKRLVAILRLAVPYTGLILTAREPSIVRDEVIPMGVSQIDGGSAIGIGEYSSKDEASFKKSQFVLSDTRSLDELIYDLAAQNYIPSFCTACYRLGRTGEHFMELSKPGEIKGFCQPNALLTFTEYLMDYASDKTKAVGTKLIEREIATFPESEMKTKLLEKMDNLKKGLRDMYF
ncbi:MAG TPA: [FeFe] hydrogenase H-cluster radical SAM maturase HydG [Candidatus Cloacimonadota bacterium]|nr:[FeFe] hydrogenase H-cluster radical SAM maturase HydG [Candidatus Cloacimonadota bacterium]